MDASQAGADFAASIKTTDSYRALEEAAQAISQKPELLRRIKQYQQKQDLLYGGKLSPGQARALSEELDADYAEMERDSALAAYLTANEAFGFMMETTMKQVYNSLQVLK